MRLPSLSPVLCLLSLLPGVLAAQGTARRAATPAVAARAAATITESDVRRRIEVIAHDSMGGRDTPSRGLDLTAAYIAGEFKRLGLAPGGDKGSYQQLYTVGRRKVVAAESALRLDDGGAVTRVPFDRDARFVRGTIPEGPLAGPTVLLAGPLTADDMNRVPVEGKVAVWLIDYTKTAETQQLLRLLIARRPLAIVQLTREPRETFAGKLATQERELPFVSGGDVTPPVVEAQEGAFAAAPAAPDFDRLRQSPSPVVIEGPAGSRIEVAITAQVTQSATAPNTVGILPGSDPALRDEYIVYSAHMDHVGTAPESRSCRPTAGDAICNGADDDASGTVGVIELAEAFATKGLRPKRSIIFLTVSGEEKGLLGSRYFADHPPVPAERLVANINLDMIGRNWPDTIVAIGKEHSDLGATLNRVNAAHPELRMTAIDDLWPNERFYFRSDHYNFARKGVPILFFFNGVHDDYHQPSDHPDKIDAEKEARLVRLLFFLGLEIANAPEKPKWNPASYAEIVQGAGGR